LPLTSAIPSHEVGTVTQKSTVLTLRLGEYDNV
jgi:hypothetical protein